MKEFRGSLVSFFLEKLKESRGHSNVFSLKYERISGSPSILLLQKLKESRGTLVFFPKMCHILGVSECFFIEKLLKDLGVP